MCSPPTLAWEARAELAPPLSSRMPAARSGGLPGAAAAAAALKGSRGNSPRMMMRPDGRLPCSSLTMLSILRGSCAAC